MIEEKLSAHDKKILLELARQSIQLATERKTLPNLIMIHFHRFCNVMGASLSH